MMAGRGIKLYLDEDVPAVLAPRLRERDYDVISCADAGRNNLRIHDEPQLAFATREGRAILTFNVRDFVPMARRWETENRSHYGIIVSARINDIGELLRRVESHLATFSPEEHYDRLIWLAGSPMLIPVEEARSDMPRDPSLAPARAEQSDRVP